MAQLDVPADVVNHMLNLLDANDPSKKATTLACRLVARSWAQCCLRFLFTYLRFEGWDDMLHFLSLLSDLSTFPRRIKSKHVTLNNLTPIDGARAQGLEDLMSVIDLPELLTIHVTTGNIGQILQVIVRHDWANIGQITLSGGRHPPAAFFTQLAALPHLRSMTLHNFDLEKPEDDGDVPTFRFPTGLNRLSLDRSSSLWHFIAAYVPADSGFANIQEISIRSQLCRDEDGVPVMVQYLRNIQGIHTLQLDVIYAGNAPYFIVDVQRNLRGHIPARPRNRLPLAKIQGLRRLKLRLADVPAHISLDAIGSYCMHLPPSNTDLSVEIEVPQAANLWVNSDPSTQLSEALCSDLSDQGFANDDTRAPLIVQGFPGALPAEIAALGRPMVCNYPVVFM